ncbi:MAG: hypothetical protein V2I97_24605 [Desulfococcaceae bacterium]|nr:hypothetical protein [Desulfococcaceae bacterium]
MQYPEKAGAGEKAAADAEWGAGLECVPDAGPAGDRCRNKARNREDSRGWYRIPTPENRDFLRKKG